MSGSKLKISFIAKYIGPKSINHFSSFLGGMGRVIIIFFFSIKHVLNKRNIKKRNNLTKWSISKC